MILTYLGAIVAANLTIAALGPAATPVVAFALIGLDLVARDRLHDQWQAHGRLGMTWRMAALIAVGGLISFALNSGALRIALASVAAFAVAAAVDTVTYQLLIRWRPLYRSNASNVPSALMDSLLFPTIAFGGFPIAIIALQFLAKTLGGLLWSAVIYRRAVLPRHT